MTIDMYHRNALHTRIAQKLSLVRQKYWIPQGRSIVRKILRACKICQKHEGGPYTMPLMPPLPTERVSVADSSQTLELIILDFFISKQKEINKRYGFVYILVW